MTMLKALLVNTQKQASAFPPNFIHSLDATHMMLTSLECRVSCPLYCKRVVSYMFAESWHHIRIGTRLVLDPCLQRN